MKASRRFMRMSFAIVGSLFFSWPATSASIQEGWSVIQSATQDKSIAINALYYEGRELWVVGADGMVMRSRDDGRNFEKVEIGIDAGLNDVYGRRDRLWIIGDGGALAISTDGGRSFVKNPQRSYRKAGSSGKKLDFYSVQFIDNDKGYIVGDEGLIMASTDGGISWQEQ
ncbi:MAG: YCF48-related protein, partial [Acidobacteriota bacterium]